MSDAQHVRSAADALENARGELQSVDEDRVAETVAKADGTLKEMSEALRELAINVEVQEETDERD